MKISKTLCYILRHSPYEFNIIPKEEGYCNTNEVLRAIRRQHPNNVITLEDLKQVVRSDNKKRYAFNKDFSSIKANYGHSFNLPDRNDSCKPPEFLFHGTNIEAYKQIKRTGLLPMDRKYVCSSDTDEIARDVANRRKGKEAYVLLKIHARKAFHEGVASFFKEECGIYQSTEIPKEYIELTDTWRND